MKKMIGRYFRIRSWYWLKVAHDRFEFCQPRTFGWEIAGFYLAWAEFLFEIARAVSPEKS